MSYTMTHLIIANEFVKTRKIADKELFLLSSVSTDAFDGLDAVHHQMDEDKLTKEMHERNC